MKKYMIGRKFAAAAMVLTLWMLPLAAGAQTRINAPKNKYKVQDDVKLGNDAARQIEQQFPILNDAEATRYVERVGGRLVNAIPPEYRQPAFIYRFKLVNASDLNAFALPGGPMYVDRGMIESARNEGEMAGVMAHEICHVALRHATAQATKQNSVGNQLGMIGLILGGAVLGGETGAQLGAATAMAWMTKYSREYETQADTLGARIMADAGYDPHDLANVFKTIAAEPGGRSPEWLSSHPDPNKRYANIDREASLLNISPNPIKITRDFERIKARLRAMPKARTMAEIEKGAQGGNTNTGGSTSSTTAGGNYSNSVGFPSTRVRSYSYGNVSLSVPTNWREFPGTSDAQFAPEGAYGDQGITRGVMVGIVQSQNSNGLSADTEAYIGQLLQGNNYLNQSGGSSRTYISGRQALSTTLSGRSPLTNRTEVVTVYTTQNADGSMFYLVTVVPQNEAYSYNGAFRNIVSSIKLGN